MTTTAPERPSGLAAEVGPAQTRARQRRWYLFGAPLLVAVVLVLTWLYVLASHPDANARVTLNPTFIAEKVVQHLELTLVAAVIALAVGISLGILLSRRGTRYATPVVLGLANIGQGAPAVGIIVLLAVVWNTGFWPAVVALSVYSVLPSLRNTMVGLRQVDPALVEAARGIGMSAPATLVKVELPLAVPVILAGIRTTLVLLVGVAALASFTGAGGLGEMITTGVTLQRYNVLVTGSVLVACLALLVDWLAGLAERFLSPRGIR